MSDTILSWAVCLLPVRLCVWLFDHVTLSPRLAPHILGRILGVDAKRVDP